MFAMTSFGAKIDESINTDRGPYVFKVSGQVYHWIGSLCPPVGEAPRFLQLYIYDTENEVENRMRHSRGEIDVPEFKIRLYNAEGTRGYELPTSNTLGVIVFDSGLTGSTDFDVVIQHRDDPAQRINKLHPSYMSLQFPLLFIYGQSGFHMELKLRSADVSGKARGGRLFQQYIVGVFYCSEQNCLDFIRKEQSDIRGGSRYMYAHYLDALAICQKLGNPQFFITFTCNVNWQEIKRHMAQYPELTTYDRADIVCRVFEQKIKALVAFLKREQTFGFVTRVLYTVRFQIRGLPHCHTLLWVDSTSKIQTAHDVNRFISSELLDPNTNPHGYQIVSDIMIHGPYGAANPSASCMQDNSYVVPYNRDLLLAFQAHINVEYCGWSMLIKYLFKYISKGTDRIFARVSRPIGESSNAADPSRQPIDEI
ncbi:DNA helicase [Tanacetum coccineum]